MPNFLPIVPISDELLSHCEHCINVIMFIRVFNEKLLDVELLDTTPEEELKAHYDQMSQMIDAMIDLMNGKFEDSDSSSDNDSIDYSKPLKESDDDPF